MANYTEAQWNAKKTELMEKCYQCFSEHGLHGTGIRILATECGFNHTKLYTYFKDLDDLIVQSTEYCMSKVEDEFMAKAPENIEELWKFIDEVPYWTAREHGKKYCLMYQVYTHPKYKESGRKFFEGVNERYSKYAEKIADNVGLPVEIMRPMIFNFIRACVHYALFEDEYYLQEQLRILRESIQMFILHNSDKSEE